MLEKNEKNLYFGKYALERAKMYINENLPLQKFIVLTEKEELINIKNCLNNEGAIYICLSEFNYEEIEKLCTAIKEEIRLVVGVGNEKIINAAKCFSAIKKIDYGIVETSFSSSLTLLKNYQIIKDNYIYEEACEWPDFYYIDSEEISKISRQNMVEMYSFISSKIGYVLDEMMSAKIFKTEFSLSTQKEMKKLLNDLNNITPSLMYKENILSLKDVIISLAFLLRKNEYSTKKDKQFVAANMFCYLTKNYKDFNQICLNYSCAFTLLYATFFVNLNSLKYSVFDIEKRVKVFDEYFSKAGFEFDYNALNNYDKTYYILSFMRETLLSQCIASHKLIKMTLDHCNSLLKDGGFEIKGRLKSPLFSKALCFAPDVIVGESLVKVVKNYGLLDFDV